MDDAERLYVIAEHRIPAAEICWAYAGSVWEGRDTGGQSFSQTRTVIKQWSDKAKGFLPFREMSSSTSWLKLAISPGSRWISLSLRPSFLSLIKLKNGCKRARNTN